MTGRVIVVETIRALPDDRSLDEIGKRIEFMAAVQKVSSNSTAVKGFLTMKSKDS